MREKLGGDELSKKRFREDNFLSKKKRQGWSFLNGKKKKKSKLLEWLEDEVKELVKQRAKELVERAWLNKKGVERSVHLFLVVP